MTQIQAWGGGEGIQHWLQWPELVGYQPFVMLGVPASLERWLDQGADAYLNLAWWVAHPLVTVVTIVVLLVLAQGILGLVSNVIKQLLLLMVKSPYLLLQWLLAKSSTSLNLPTLSLKSPTLKRVPNQPSQTSDRLLSAIRQLEATQKEQTQILKELKSILAAHQKQGAAAKSASHSSTTQKTTSKPQSNG